MASVFSAEVYHHIGEVKTSAWDFVASTAHGSSLFHGSKWLKAYESGTGRKARHIVVYKNGNIIAVFPHFVERVGSTNFHRLDSVRPGYGGPLILADENEVLPLIRRGVSEACQGVISHRIMSINPHFLRYARYWHNEGYDLDVDNGVFSIQVDQSDDALLYCMSKARRRIVRNAIREAYLFREAVDRSELEEFYGNYCSTLRRLGEPPFSLNFFEVLREEYGDDCKLFSLSIGGKYSTGAICLLDRLRSIVHFVFIGINYDDYQRYSSELMYFEMMKWARSSGFKVLDIGGVKSDYRDGLFRFKADFGLRLAPCFCWERGYSRLGWAALSFGKRLKRLGLVS